MNREKFEEMKRVSAEISAELRRGDLTPEQRAQLELHQAQLAGTLLHPWLPFSWWRRAILAAASGRALATG